MPNLSEQRLGFELLARTASLYYLEDKTQDEVARELNISRQKVQRLLQQAREQGIVEINVHIPPLVPLELEKELKAHFNLVDVVVAASHPDEERCRQSVARAAASYLERQLSDGQVVAIGMGRNVGKIPDFFHSSRRIACTFVSAMGGSPHVGESTNPNNICQRLAEKSGGCLATLYAPAYVESQRIRDMLLTQEAIGQTLAQAKRADIVVVGIGTPDDECTLVQMGCLSLAEAQRLRNLGAVGDLLGDYFDENGKEVPSDLHTRLVGLRLSDLRNVSRVTAVVSEQGKALAILGVLRSKLVHVLITDAANALAVLQLAGVTKIGEEN